MKKLISLLIILAIGLTVIGCILSPGCRSPSNSDSDQFYGFRVIGDDPGQVEVHMPKENLRNSFRMEVRRGDELVGGKTWEGGSVDLFADTALVKVPLNKEVSAGENLRVTMYSEGEELASSDFEVKKSEYSYLLP